MADTFLEFARGDLIIASSVGSGILAEVQDGTFSLMNGAQIIKFLRTGVGGWHIGTQEATVSWKQAVIKAGMKQDYLKLIMSKKPVATISFIVNDVARVQVVGILNGASFSFGEASHVTGDFNVHGRPDYTPL